MKTEDFEVLVGKRLHNAKAVLVDKAKLYASEADRLHNFKAGAQLLGITPELYAFALVTKHWISINDKILSDEVMSSEFVDEKLGDVINYMLLLEALITERRQHGRKAI